MPPNSDKCGKYATNLPTPVNVAFTALLLMTFAVIWYILCRAAKFIDGLKCSKAFVAVYCFIVHGSEVPSELVQLVTDVCCVGLHCDAEG